MQGSARYIVLYDMRQNINLAYRYTPEQCQWLKAKKNQKDT